MQLIKMAINKVKKYVAQSTFATTLFMAQQSHKMINSILFTHYLAHRSIAVYLPLQRTNAQNG